MSTQPQFELLINNLQWMTSSKKSEFHNLQKKDYHKIVQFSQQTPFQSFYTINSSNPADKIDW